MTLIVTSFSVIFKNSLISVSITMLINNPTDLLTQAVEQLVEEVTTKIKRDIANGMEAFLKNLPGRTDTP